MKAHIVKTTDIPYPVELKMYKLMCRYYCNVKPGQFHSDLREKDFVIMLIENGELRGFSTQILYTIDLKGQKVRVLFSGDTITHRDHRNSMALSLEWGKKMKEIEKSNPDIPLYWALTSKGYKTYRFLPTFFVNYFPKAGGSLSCCESMIAAEFGKVKYGNRFDPETYIIKAEHNGQYLNSTDAEITPARRKNPAIAFFEMCNPGYVRGNELLCIARFSSENLKPFIKRKIYSREYV